jgi:flagellar basal-body rod protein FlgC
MFNTLDLATGGLRAQRTRMDVIAGNVVNVQTTRNEQGESIPFRRRVAMLQATDATNPDKPGVHVSQVALDPSPFTERHDPGHPDADPQTGLVKYPNVDLTTEYVNMLEASRAYEANVSVMQTTRAMFNSALRLIA